MLKHKHSRASAGEICVARIDQSSHLAAVHLSFEVDRVLLNGKLAYQYKICAPPTNSLRCLRVIATLWTRYSIPNANVVCTSAAKNVVRSFEAGITTTSSFISTTLAPY